MKFREFFSNFYLNVKEGVSRFIIAFISTLLFFFTVSFEIIFETNRDEIIVPLCLGFALTAVLSVLLKTLNEYITDKLKPLIQYTLCALCGIAAFFLTEGFYESLYTYMAYTGIMIALICFIFFILMRGKERDLIFPKIVTSWVFSGAVCSVLSGGLSTCIAAFQSLIFSWSNFHKVYLIVNLFVWVIGFINIFLSYIPKKDIPIPQSKIFRTFVLFAGLPLYILLIAILLLYLAKIVITWNMPVGEINWFASFASLFFIFFLLSVMQYKEKIARLFVKYGGYFLIPVLIMQAIAVFERINAYGLTTPRTVSLVLIVISILFIAGSVVIPKHLEKIALISGIIALIVTVTPFNVIDMPIASQTNILKTVLERNGMLTDGKVIPKSDIDDKDAEKIISAFEYLKYDAKKIPEFITNPKQTIPEIFGFTKKYNDSNNNVFHCNFYSKKSIDISDYDAMLKVYNDDMAINFEHNGKEHSIDLKQIALKLYSEYGVEGTQTDIYKVDENTALYFNNFSFTMDNEEITYCHYNGYVLLKE